MSTQSSFAFFSKHWAKFASGLLFLLGAIEVLAGGLSESSRVEFYLLAWGSMAGGVWFLFDIAEKSAKTEYRELLTSWINEADYSDRIGEIPRRFARLFDLVFGEKHFTFKCFRRSVIASIISAWIVTSIVMGVDPGAFGAGFTASIEDPVVNPSLVTIGMLGFYAIVVNILPDYLSLLQTRYLLRFITSARSMVVVLLLDVALTALIFLFVIIFGGFAITFLSSWIFFYDMSSEDMFRFVTPWMMFSNYVEGALESIAFLETSRRSISTNLLGPLFLTTFFTSIWLWLYCVAALLSKALTKFNNGMGLLVSMTDFESQPFRSLGFVSVVLVSLIFALFAPLVFLI